MSTRDNMPNGPDDRSSPSKRLSGDADAPGHDARLAHELANLLDGSLRNVNLVMRKLGQGPSRSFQRDVLRDLGVRSPAPERQADDPVKPPGLGRDDGDDPAEEDLLRRLRTVDDSMRQMAHLLRRWLEEHRLPESLGGESRTVAETVHHAVRLLEPAASHHGVEIVVELAPEAIELPGGPVYPVIANALRNSIESIARSASDHNPAVGKHIAVQVTRCDNDIIIKVIDTGPGLDDHLFDDNGQFRFGRTTKPAGHGLGLSLSRDIASNLHGSLRLANNTDGVGATLTLRYPIPDQLANP